MKLEDQVTNLEISKRLRELGVKQDSYFVHYKLKENEEWNYPTESWQVEDNIRFDTLNCYTASELGELLPKGTSSFKGDFEWKWECSYDCGNDFHYTSGGETEADSRGRMLIHLLEQKLITVDEVNR